MSDFIDDRRFDDYEMCNERREMPNDVTRNGLKITKNSLDVTRNGLHLTQCQFSITK